MYIDPVSCILYPVYTSALATFRYLNSSALKNPVLFFLPPTRAAKAPPVLHSTRGSEKLLIELELLQQKAMLTQLIALRGVLRPSRPHATDAA